MGHAGNRKVKGEKETVERRQGRTAQPILINIGVAIACSFAGFVLSQTGNKTRPNPSVPSLVIEEEQEEEHECSCNLAQEKCNFMTEITHSKTDIGSSATHTTVSTLSPASLTRSSSGDEVGFLLPEFNDIVLEEFGSSMPDLCPDPNRNLTQIQSTVEIENEISFLRNMVSSLQEREKSLELQIQEFYNLKERTDSICQLENQLKVKNVETKLYTIKMGSLLTENHNLRAQLSENSTILVWLEDARKQIKILTDRVQILREEMEQMHKEEEAKSKKFEELEEELKDLRLANACLEKEKLELKRQLQLQTVESQLEPTCHTSKEIETIDEAENLRQEVEKLTREIEQLKISRCADLEELVYLKWINACLRYELRDHHPSHGKTLARDLSIRLSPSSKQKAKQLIQDYACDTRATFLYDANWVYSSESSGDSSKSSNSNKPKLFGKLKDLLLGKDEKMIERGEDTPSFSSWGSTASCCTTDELALPVHLQRPLDQQDKLARSRSDCLGYKREGIVPKEEGFTGNSYDETEGPEKMRLRRLAAALGDPRGNINRRTTSNSFSAESKIKYKENKIDRE